MKAATQRNSKWIESSIFLWRFEMLLFLFISSILHRLLSTHKWVMTVNMKVKHLLSCCLNIYLFDDHIDILFKLRRTGLNDTRSMLSYLLYLVLAHNATFWSFGCKLVWNSRYCFCLSRRRREIKRATNRYTDLRSYFVC